MSNPENQPTCHDTEMALIGACLRDPELTPFASDCVESVDFSDNVFAFAWSHILESFHAGNPPSIIKLEREFGFDDYFSTLRSASRLYDQDGVKHAALLVNDFALRRRVMNICGEGLERSGSDHLSCQASDIVMEISSQLASVKGMSDTSVSAGEVVKEIAEEMASTQALDVFPTGIDQIDRMMEGGVYSSKFYGIAARQKHGKTTTLATISYNMAYRSVPHLYLTMEGATTEIIQTMLGRHIGTNRISFLKREFRENQRSLEAVLEAEKFFEASGLRMDKKPGITFSQLKNIISRAAIKGQIRGVIVDYIQLVKPDHDFRGTQAQHFDDVAQYLAEVAKVYGIWVIGAAQLNRDGEVRGGDGLLNACDMAIYQHKLKGKQFVEGERGEVEALWLEMRASRYTPYRNLGSEECAGMYFVRRCGPYVETIPGVLAE